MNPKTHTKKKKSNQKSHKQLSSSLKKEDQMTPISSKWMGSQRKENTLDKENVNIFEKNIESLEEIDSKTKENMKFYSSIIELSEGYDR